MSDTVSSTAKPLEAYDLRVDAQIVSLRIDRLHPALAAGDYAEVDRILAHIVEARPDRFKEHIERVDHALTNGEYERAAHLFDAIGVDFSADVSGATTDHDTAALRIALRLKRHELAAAIAARHAPDFDQSSLMANLAMRAFDRAGRPDDAIAAAHQLVRLAPDAPDALGEVASFLNGQGKMAQTVDLLTPLDLLQFDHFDLLLQAGRALAKDGTRADDTIAVLSKAHVLDPAHPQPRLLLARSYMAMEQPEDALAAIRYDPQQIKDEPESLRAQAAEVLLANDKAADAAKIFFKLLTERPDHSGWKQTYVTALLQAGQAKTAEAVYASLPVPMTYPPQGAALAYACAALRAALRLQKPALAAELAAPFEPEFASDPILAVLSMRAFERDKQGKRACAAAEALAKMVDLDNPAPLIEAVALLSSHGRGRQAVELLDRFPMESCTDFDLLLQAGRAMSLSHQFDDRAIEVLSKARDINPEHPQARLFLSRAFMRLNQPRRALEALNYDTTTIDGAPESLRGQAVETLMANNRHGDAVALLKRLVADNPNHSGWKRASVSALLLSGDTAGAEALYTDDLSRRPMIARNYTDFGEALADLDNLIDTAQIPDYRFEWAYQRLKYLGCAPDDRGVWERRCKWVHLADHLTIDWIEGRTNEVEQILDRMHGLEDGTEELRFYENKGMGVFLTAAHIGALFSSPLALTRAASNYRWIASTPVIASVPGSEFLISTFSQNRLRLAKQIYKAVRAGAVVSLAADGMQRGRRVQFLDDEIYVSDFVPRAIHQLGAPCLFPKFMWEDDQISVSVIRLCSPEPGEQLEDYIERWSNDYARVLADCFATNPDNMRLTGGIWDNVRL
ncbi:tetratricopeptide repeat protein [Yoonia sp. R2-816]|uniref:tetratricopeptide repeat protein n=1 Tax=Yoonia sp. R2-816 TaxID=3342638 RepID=UPI00372C8692